MHRAPAPSRLFLIRHGETAANAELRYLGTRDDPLTERGRGQADLLARALAELPIQAVYSSPLSRADSTAQPIAQALGLVVRTETRLREASFGEWEGLTRAEVRSRSVRDREMLERWESDPAAAPPGGEAFLEVSRRVMSSISEIAGRHAGEWVVLVTHVSPIKSVLGAAVGAGFDAARRLFLDPATISVVDWGEPPLVRLFNAHGHLGWRAARWMQVSQPRTGGSP